MKNEIIVLPVEVSELATRVSEKKQAEVMTVLTQIFAGTDSWSDQVDAIEVKSIDDKFSIELADAARKNSKNARLSAEKIFDAKRDEVQILKSEFDLEDKLWLKAKQVMQIKFKAIEEKAEFKANFVKRHEAEQKELKTQDRILKVAEYSDVNRFQFENMTDDIFAVFLNGLAVEKASREAEQAEIVRKKIADDKAREEQRIENERLKAEAVKAEAVLDLERKENAQKQLLAEQKIKLAEKAIADEKAKAVALENQRLADEKAKAVALENQRLADEKAKKAPLKNQLKMWVDGFSLPISEIDHAQKTAISEKFELFKNWAKTQIETI